MIVWRGAEEYRHSKRAVDRGCNIKELSWRGMRQGRDWH